MITYLAVIAYSVQSTSINYVPNVPIYQSWACVFVFSWKPIIQYIDSKFEEYLGEESKVQRQPFSDNRVHCCLYFIAPTGHCLKPLDIEFMKKLHNKVKRIYKHLYTVVKVKTEWKIVICFTMKICMELTFQTLVLYRRKWKEKKEWSE